MQLFFQDTNVRGFTCFPLFPFIAGNQSKFAELIRTKGNAYNNFCFALLI